MLLRCQSWRHPVKYSLKQCNKVHAIGQRGRSLLSNPNDDPCTQDSTSLGSHAEAVDIDTLFRWPTQDSVRLEVSLIVSYCFHSVERGHPDSKQENSIMADPKDSPSKAAIPLELLKVEAAFVKRAVTSSSDKRSKGRGAPSYKRDVMYAASKHRSDVTIFSLEAPPARRVHDSLPLPASL